MIKSKGSSGNLTQVDGPKIPLDTREPTTPYIIGLELNLRKTARLAVGVEPTTFQTAVTDDDKG